MAKGLAIMRHLIGRVSGMAVPTPFALDAPGGGGKIPPPDFIRSLSEHSLEFWNYDGLACSYPNPRGATEDVPTECMVYYD